MIYEDRILLAVGRSQGAEQEDIVTLLVRQHATFVYRIAYSILRDVHDAEDVAQETFMRVMKNIERLPLIRDQRGWLARIAWRLAITKWNRTKKRRHVEIDISEDSARLAASTLSTELDTQNKELVETISRLTFSLPADLRNPLILSAIEEMGSREVAEILNISEVTVRTRVHRARRLLRKKLQKLIGKD
jgi:RNA polymerase sigma-70 factor (ECF subfamily)